MFLEKLISDFKPHKMGYKKVLGDLEADVMKNIWKMEKATVREVYEQLRLEKNLAYTTVMTIMGRLAEKGLLAKEAQGNAYLYIPTISEDDFAKKVVSEVLDGLLEEFAEPALSHMVDKLSTEDTGKLDRLEQIIKERRKKGAE
ncbi:MAG: BlaI/MecI/CopY family transcriptional regulator [Thermincola sp.]|jgi:predicted transcriptional regulator|nr:BlaI/MecI/CopY family transcriptional regulator [Thermincola sp.]MDT3704184.1 BlaI/MecI/CopY family transcriptional regulator [Thermincola sp.]